jgi:hypothetical protein
MNQVSEVNPPVYFTLNGRIAGPTICLSGGEQMRFKRRKENPLEAALQARLEAIAEEIDRLTRLAASVKDSASQRQYWEMAREAQAEARKLREEFSRIAPKAAIRPLWTPITEWLKAHTRHRDELSLIQHRRV